MQQTMKKKHNSKNLVNVLEHPLYSPDFDNLTLAR
jgi:hypothetical protein